MFHNATSYEAGKEEDKYTSSKYLITDARHKLIRQLLTIIECVKDTGTKEEQMRLGACKSMIYHFLSS